MAIPLMRFDTPLKLFVGSLVLAALGAGCVWIGFHLRRDVKRMARYVSANGVVTSSTLRTEPGGRSGLTQGFAPAVEYQFSANGATYTGDHIAFAGEWSAYEDQMRARIAGYPVGAPVTVWYDPADPNQAVLERADPGDSQWGAFCVGIGFLLLAALGFVSVLVQRSQSQDGPDDGP